MGLFANPLSYAGYPPGVTGTPTTQNASIRAATLTEASAGVLNNCYISPSTLGGSVALDFANPPALGYGSTTQNTPIHSGTITLADAANIVVGTTTGTKIGTTTSQKLGFFAATPIVQPVTTTDIKVALVNLGLLASGASPLNLGSAALASGTYTIADGSNIIVGSTTGTQIATATTQKLGFFGATPIVQPAAATDIKTTLVNLGLLATGASPLNLGSATLTAGTVTCEQINSTATGSDVAGTFTAPTALIPAVTCAVGSIKVPATSVAGATPITNNVRTGQCSFTDVVSNGATGALVNTNSLITSASVIIPVISCATAGSAMKIISIVPGSGTVTFNVKNEGGTSSSGNNININFWILN